jgi:two-component system sensor histidine kinase UhpB
VLENLGLRPALERLAAEEATALRLRIDLDAGDLGSERLPADLETAVYRIVQEALANAGKHAAAGRIWILLARENGAVKVTVRDDGCGFDSEGTLRTSAARGRLGLHGMRERAMMLGGQLHIASKRGSGTTVSARIPVAARPRGQPGLSAKGTP